MGIPLRRLICASNINNVLTDFLHTGVYDLRKRPLSVTISPAIDILKSSNLERYVQMLLRTASYGFISLLAFFTIFPMPCNVL